MRAIQFATYGPPDVMRSVTLPTPEAGAGEVRVRLQAAGVAPFDAKLRAGLLQAHFAPPLPKIPGRDGTGVIDQVGAGVGGLSLGYPVCLMADPTRGTYAEAIVCSAERVVPRPAGLTLHQAAALLQPANSAWIAVVEAAQVGSGMRVLVHGGAGAVGSAMVQLCRHLGAHVTATCRAGNEDYAVGLGADQAIAYDRNDFGTLREQDVVFDLIGGEVHARSYPLLRRGGQLVYLTAAPIVDRGAEFGVTVTRALITDRPEVLAEVGRLATQGVLRPRVAGVYALDDAARAHAALESGQVTRGRLVLDIAP